MSEFKNLSQDSFLVSYPWDVKMLWIIPDLNPLIGFDILVFFKYIMEFQVMHLTPFLDFSVSQ